MSHRYLQRDNIFVDTPYTSGRYPNVCSFLDSSFRTTWYASPERSQLQMELSAPPRRVSRQLVLSLWDSGKMPLTSVSLASLFGWDNAGVYIDIYAIYGRYPWHIYDIYMNIYMYMSMTYLRHIYAGASAGCSTAPTGMPTCTAL